MKKIVVIISLFSLISFSFIDISNIKLEDMKTGKISSYSSLFGKKKTYIKVWASWCHYCINSLQELDNISSKKNLDYNVISIVSPDNKKDFKENWEFDYNDLYKNIKIFYVSNNDIKNILKIKGYPTNIYVNSNCLIKEKKTGIIKNYISNRIMKKLK